MCVPVGAALAVVQAGTQIAGGIYQQKAAKQAAIQAEREAIYEQQRMVSDAEQIRANNARELGAMRAAFSTRGVSYDSSSLQDVLAEAAGNLDLAALMKEHEGVLARYRGRAQAAQYKTAGRNALYQSLLGGATGLVAKGIDAGWWGKGGTQSSAQNPPTGGVF